VTEPAEIGRAKGDVVLSVRNLDIDFWVDGIWYPAAVGIDFELRSGDVLAIVGESGSGKSTTAMALLGLLPRNSRVFGSIKLGGRELVGLDPNSMRRLRGEEISVIFQEPMTALNPVYTVGFQIVEMIRTHRGLSPKAARERALDLLKLVEIPEPERRINSYPHQLSGGQRQRVMIAQALACDPKILVADEPTTALDVTVQAEILKLMRDLRDRIDAAIVLITHDMGVVADMSDRIMVMKDGKVVERGTSEEIFYRPQHPYTTELLNSVPHLGGIVDPESATRVDGHIVGFTDVVAPEHRFPVIAPEAVEPIVELTDIAIEYPKQGRVPAFRAVDGISLSIGPAEVVGLVGESGSGKTTIGRALVGLLPVVEGSAKVCGLDIAGKKKPGDYKPIRKLVSFVFQDPGSSLNPRLPIGESIGEPLLLHGVAKGKALSARVEALLDQVHLSRSMRNRYPHELSGGQRQRVGIARSLALEPKLLIADEPTSALDVSVQARVLELFQELQAQHGFACLFISHDLAVVEILAGRIAVMHHGKLVEVGSREKILNDPQEAYTKRLLAAVPVPDPMQQQARRAERDALLAAAAAEIEKDDEDRTPPPATHNTFI